MQHKASYNLWIVPRAQLSTAQSPAIRGEQLYNLVFYLHHLGFTDYYLGAGFDVVKRI